MPLRQYLTYVVAKRHPHRCHLQRVCEPVVYEDASWQGEHLCLVLQPSERCGEYQPVVVSLELRAVVVPESMSLFLAEPFVRN